MHSHFLLGNVLEYKVFYTRNSSQVHLYQISTLPGSGAKAGRSVVEVFAGGPRGESEVGHRLPQPGIDVPLLDGFARCKSYRTFASKCLTILNVSSGQKLFSHLDFLEEEPLDSLLV